MSLSTDNGAQNVRNFKAMSVSQWLVYHDMLLKATVSCIEAESTKKIDVTDKIKVSKLSTMSLCRLFLIIKRLKTQLRLSNNSEIISIVEEIDVGLSNAFFANLRNRDLDYRKLDTKSHIISSMYVIGNGVFFYRGLLSRPSLKELYIYLIMSKSFDVIMYSNSFHLQVPTCVMATTTILFCFVLLEAKSRQAAGKASMTAIEDNLHLKLNLVLMTRIVVAVVINLATDLSFTHIIVDASMQREMSVILLSYYYCLLMITFIQSELKSDKFNHFVTLCDQILYFPLTVMSLLWPSFGDAVPSSDFAKIKNAIRSLSDEVVLESFYVPDVSQVSQSTSSTSTGNGNENIGCVSLELISSNLTDI
jgi:hypothetical protein